MHIFSTLKTEGNKEYEHFNMMNIMKSENVGDKNN